MFCILLKDSVSGSDVDSVHRFSIANTGTSECYSRVHSKQLLYDVNTCQIVQTCKYVVLHKVLSDSGLYNFQHASILVDSNLNIPI